MSFWVIPPFRFSIIEDDLFRGAFPTEKNYHFLKRLHLKTMISLLPEESKELNSFCERESITHHTYIVPKGHSELVQISNSTIETVMNTIICSDNLPLYLHCLDGTHVTGFIVMCLRKLQHWVISGIFSEFSRFIIGGISLYESELLSNTQLIITVPNNTPQWLWNGERNVSHPNADITLVYPEKVSAKIHMIDALALEVHSKRSSKLSKKKE